MLSLMPLPLLVENVLTIGKIFFPGFLVVFDQLFGGVWVTIVFCCWVFYCTTFLKFLTTVFICLQFQPRHV